MQEERKSGCFPDQPLHVYIILYSNLFISSPGTILVFSKPKKRGCIRHQSGQEARSSTTATKIALG